MCKTEKSLIATPSNSAILYWVSTKRCFIRDNAGEIEDLNEAIEIYNKSESFALRAELKTRLGDLEGALKD